MTRNKVSAQTAIGAKGSFEIDERTGSGESEVRSFPGFPAANRIARAVVGSGTRLCHGQTASIHSQAVSRSQVATAYVGLNHQTNRGRRLRPMLLTMPVSSMMPVNMKLLTLQ